MLSVLALSEVDAAIEAALNYILRRQDDQGFWSDFHTLAGESTYWVSGFVGRHLLTCLPNSESIPKAIEALLACEQVTGGWGYGKDVPSDSDSTINVLLFLARANREPQGGWSRFIEILADYQNPQGGFATFASSNLISTYMQLPEKVSFRGWTSAHPEVTAAAVILMHEIGGVQFQGPIQKAIAFLLGNQRFEGYWPAYWWVGPYAGTCLTLQALAAVGLSSNSPYIQRALKWLLSRQSPDGSWDTGFEPRAPGFSTALALTALTTYEPKWISDGRVEAGVRQLLKKQNEDGSWPAELKMRIPSPWIEHPDEGFGWNYDDRGTNTIIRDQNRLYTTTTSMNALLACRKFFSSRGFMMPEWVSDQEQAVKAVQNCRMWLIPELACNYNADLVGRGKLLLQELFAKYMSEEASALVRSNASEVGLSEVAMAKVLGFGHAYGVVIADLLGLSPKRAEEAAKLCAQFNLGIALFDYLVDEKSDEYAEVRRWISSDYLKNALDSEFNRSAEGPTGQSPSLASFLLNIADDLLRIYRAIGKTSPSAAGVFAKILPLMHRAQIESLDPRERTDVTYRQVHQWLRQKSSYPFLAMGLLIAMAGERPLIGTLQVFCQLCLAIGDVFWVTDDAADIDKDRWNGTWNRLLLESYDSRLIPRSKDRSSMSRNQKLVHGDLIQTLLETSLTRARIAIACYPCDVSAGHRLESFLTAAVLDWMGMAVRFRCRRVAPLIDETISGSSLAMVSS